MGGGGGGGEAVHLLKRRLCWGRYFTAVFVIFLIIVIGLNQLHVIYHHFIGLMLLF